MRWFAPEEPAATQPGTSSTSDSASESEDELAKPRLVPLLLAKLLAGKALLAAKPPLAGHRAAVCPGVLRGHESARVCVCRQLHASLPACER